MIEIIVVSLNDYYLHSIILHLVIVHTLESVRGSQGFILLHLQMQKELNRISWHGLAISKNPHQYDAHIKASTAGYRFCLLYSAVGAAEHIVVSFLMAWESERSTWGRHRWKSLLRHCRILRNSWVQKRAWRASSRQKTDNRLPPPGELEQWDPGRAVPKILQWR